MTTYSQDLRLSLIADGTQVGTWGDTTNANLGTLIEQAIAGVSGGPSTTGTYPSITMPSDANYALTANNGAVDQARNAVIVINSTPTLSQTRYIIAPAGASKVYIVKNSTSGSQAIAMSYGTTSAPTGAAVSVANGTTSIVYGDGTNFYGVSASGGGGGGSSIAINEQAFVATAGQTVFNLTSFSYTPGINSLQVYVNGLKQVLGEAYTETSTTSFTFVTGLNDGAIVEALGGAALAQSISALNVAYNEGGTGAVTTTVQAKLQQTVSVMDFGAKGDGTTDDTTAINNAIAAIASPAGGTIYFPVGNYKITSTITWSDKPITLSGDGCGYQPGTGTRITVASGVTGFIVQNGSNGYGRDSCIENLNILSLSSGAGSDVGILVQSKMTLRNVMVQNFGSHGVEVLSGISAPDVSINANLFYFENLKCYSNRGNGLHVVGVDSNAGSTINFDGSLNTGWGLYDIANISNTHIGPHVSGNAAGGFYFKQYTRVLGGYKETDGLSGVTIASGGAGYCNLDFLANEDPITDNGGGLSRITIRGAGAVISTNLAVASGVSATPAMLAKSTSIDITVPINSTAANPINAISTATTSYVVSAKSPTAFTGQNYYSNSVTASGTTWNHFLGQSANASVTNIIIYGNGNIQNANNSYGAISDASLKENVVDATPKLNDLLKIKIKNFNLISDESKEKQIGVIAQELQTVFPSMVTTDQDGKLGVKYSVFVPILIKAIQELSAKVTALENNG